jgi:hypothetical protein
VIVAAQEQVDLRTPLGQNCVIIPTHVSQRDNKVAFLEKKKQHVKVLRNRIMAYI